MTQMRIRTYILIPAGLVFLAVAAVPYLVSHALRARVGPQHIFALTHSALFLTEELALTKALESLTLDGLQVSGWHPQREGRTSAPDGRKDQFGTRNTINSNRLVFAFTNGSGSMRLVSVALTGRQLSCQASGGK